MTTTAAAPTQPLTGERADLLDVLHKHRGLFRVTVQGLSDEQARTRSTVSELTLGGLIKHVAQVEKEWAGFVARARLSGPTSTGRTSTGATRRPRSPSTPTASGCWRARPWPALLEEYDAVAAATDALVATVDLDSSQPLPEAPWFAPGARWSARRVFTHILAETAQHAGHADIIREAIDGQKSMG